VDIPEPAPDRRHGPRGSPRIELASRARRSLLALCSAALGAVAHASDYFEPYGPEFRVNVYTTNNQIWVRTSILDDASAVAFSFNSGNDPFARQTTLLGTSVTPVLTCNPTLNTGTQDEAETAFSSSGRQLVAWSERSGYDGQLMGIFGRIFLPGGAALGPEFQINEVWQTSQWRPLIARRPGGGWVVAWSSDWDGDAVFRLVDDDGTFPGGDVAVNTFDNGGQTDTAVGVAPDGTMLLVFVDYSGWAGVGSGKNLWGRLFDADGAPLQALEFPLTTAAYSAGDQGEPRVAADGLGRFVVTWEDAQKDGSSWGVFARRFDLDGMPLGPEFAVHTTTAGAQRSPRVAADALGNFVIAWEDWSTGDSDVRLQRFDPSGAPVGGELVVNTTTAGDQRRPGIAMTPQTGDVVVCFEGPGNSTDVWARAFNMYRPPTPYCTALVNSLGCVPQSWWSGTASLGGADDFHVGANQVLNNRNGLLFFGYASTAVPFYGGTLCVAFPVVRTPIQYAGGSPSGDDCTGVYDFHFSHAFMGSRGLTPGTSIFLQHWSRDPYAAESIGLTDALAVDVKP
jgi:hypothetical protein